MPPKNRHGGRHHRKHPKHPKHPTLPPPPPPPEVQPPGTTGAAVVYPSGKSVDPALGTSDWWETPQYLLGLENDGQRWVEMEVRFWDKPPLKFVERWLQQTLRFEIGEELSHKALRFMKGEVRNSRIQFKKFLGEIARYLRRNRPKPLR